MWLAAGMALALVGTAAGAPAGDEYLPQVPKAAGKGVVAGEETGPGATILSPEVRGREGADAAELMRQAASPDGSGESSDDSGGAGDTLLDPVVLLLIAGVAAATVGMTLRRRQALAHEPGPEGAAREAGSAPPTPSGEIVERDEQGKSPT